MNNAFTDLASFFPIPEDNSNPWHKTSIEHYYKLNPRAKGLYGEDVIESILIDKYDWDIETCDNSKNLGYDCKINGIKTEIKFSTALERSSPKIYLLTNRVEKIVKMMIGVLINKIVKNFSSILMLKCLLVKHK